MLIISLIILNHDSGLAFLWIDALCIVQDPDDGDWAIEAGRMSSVYGGAFVSLAASDARDVYQGFLSRSSKNHYSGGFLARVTINKVLCEVRRFYDPMDYARLVTDCHLSTRGWTLQEKLLPLRTIHFGDKGIWWDCRSQTSSNYLPDGDLTGIAGTNFMPPIGQPWDWAKIAWHYSEANLTYGSDRLAALSGIAARQHEATGDQYLAGLWRESLIYDLLWRLEEHLEDFSPPGTERPERNRCRPQWRAPTWSWISVDGKVAFGCHSQSELLGWSMNGHSPSSDESSYKEYVRVLEAETIPSGPDPFGPVSSGHLTLSCSKFVRGRLGRIDGPEDIAGTVDCDCDLGVFPVFIDCWENNLLQDGGSVYLVPFLKGRYSIWGLLVQAIDLSNGQFQRVGCFSFLMQDMSEHGPNHFLKFLEILEQLGNSTAAAGCAHTTPPPEGEEGQYAMTLM